VQAKEREALSLSETKAEEGDVDGAMLFAKQAEAFATQHETTLKQLTQPDRIMTVCEVCGVFINMVETDRKGKAGVEPVRPAFPCSCVIN
jgi:RNA-binding protein Luc7-like 2